MSKKEIEEASSEGPLSAKISRRSALGLLSGGAAAMSVGAMLPTKGLLRGLEARTTGPSLSEIEKLLGPFDKATSGKGMTIPVGAVLAFTGSGSYYGTVMSQGINLAVKHIKAMGGPDFKLIYRDNQSGLPQPGISAAREFGTSGVKIMLSSYGADFDAMLPEIAQYKIFALDAGGANPSVLGKPFFWSTTLDAPNGAFPGIFGYVKHELPSAKKFAYVGWDTGTATDTYAQTGFTAAVQALGGTVVSFQNIPIGLASYTDVMTLLVQADPDVVVNFSGGTDTGYFMKGYATSGLTAPVFGTGFTPAASTAGGTAFNGYKFVDRYFNAAAPSNPWAEYFTKAFDAAYGTQAFSPEDYSADYYEATFLLWALVRRLNAKKQKITGPNMQNALKEDPTFQSLYGGTSKSVGSLSVSLSSHILGKGALGVYEYNSGSVKQLASINVDGTGFTLT